MPASAITLILLSALVALALAWLQYFYRSKGKTRFNYVLAFLRSLSIFFVLLLLINPKIESTQYFTEKPNLLLTVDNSASIAHFEKQLEVREFVKEIEEHPEIKTRFNVQTFSFGKEVKTASNFSFSEAQTNIHEAFQTYRDLYQGKASPVLLISDGNQTYGADFLSGARRFPDKVYPIVVGDTTQYQDLSIKRINVNKHSLLNNKFPVEMFVNYSGESPVHTELQISQAGKVLFSQALYFDEDKNSEVLEVFLPASKVGVSTYKAEILPLSQERNLHNNLKNFAVEVIDERSSVLLLANSVHPDLGSLKRSIESNKQREVVIKRVTDSFENLEDYDLVVLYQPTELFAPYMEELQEANRNFWLITGPETDWDYVNRIQAHFQKQLSGQVEEYFADYNPDYQPFQISDVGFSEFPPLVDIFGKLEGGQASGTILFQQIQGLSTKAPLMATVEEENSRKAFLFGANIWQWRAQSYLQTGSFEVFDTFIGNLIQYLASDKKRDRLYVDYEPIYNANEEILISADYLDENYNFDPRAELFLELESENAEVQHIPFSLSGNTYEANLSGIAASEYKFRVKVEGENLSRSGAFTVVEHDLEKQFHAANLDALTALAEMKDVKLYSLRDSQDIIEELLEDNTYIPIQKSRQKNVSLIDWYYLLALALLSLSAEWFIRKYQGLI